MSEEERKIQRLPDGAIARGWGMSSEEKQARAEDRRRRPTAAESALWERLREGRLEGFSFKRETEILGWYADFYCAAARLVVEVDGKEHALRRLEDNRRDETMRANHYRVLRIPAWRVFRDLDAVVEQVRAAVATPWARSRRDRFVQLAKDSRNRPQAADADPPDDAPVELARRRRPTPLRRKLECPSCERRFVTDVYASPWIECRDCLIQPRPVCRACNKTVTKVVSVAGWRCRDCEEYHSVAVDSAGPGGNRSLGPLPQSKRGKRYMGPS